MAEHMSEFVKIAAIENMIEAQILETELLERDIPHRIRSFHDTAYDGLFQLQKGWGEIYAPAVHEKEILDILSDARR